MKLKSFEVHSYRSCIKTKLQLHDELTCLIGINGAGKSNLLNAIILLRKLCRARLSTMPQEKSFNTCKLEFDIEIDGKRIAIKGDLTYETDERNYDEVINANLKWNLFEFTGDKSWINIPIHLLSYRELDFKEYSPQLFRHMLKYQKTELEKLMDVWPKIKDAIVKRTYEFLNGISYYSASQFSDPSRCPVSIELEDNRPVRRMRSSNEHDQFIFDLYKSFKENGPEYCRYKSAVDSSGIGLLDDISFTEVEMPSSSYEVQSGAKIKKIERNRLLVVPCFTVNGNKLSPNQLSEGTFKTLALLFYILTDNSSLLLIEEPEVCTHHGLLSSIILLIKSQSKHKQIVISTHSDFVLDHIDPENLILVKRDENGTGTKASQLTKTLSKRDYKALKSYLEESGNLGEYWREGGLDNG